MTINYELGRRQTYQKLFRILNAIQPSPVSVIAQSEIDLLVEVLLLPYKYQFQRFSSQAKKKVRDAVSQRGWDLTPENFNNKVYSLISKGILTRDEDNLIEFAHPYAKIIMDVEEAISKNKPWQLTFNFNASQTPLPSNTADSKGDVITGGDSKISN